LGININRLEKNSENLKNKSNTWKILSYKMKNTQDFESRLERSRMLHSNGDLYGAKTCCERLLAEYPKQVQVMQILGWINAQIGQWKNAVEILTKGIEIDPKNQQSYYILGNIMCKFASWSGGVECYKKTLEIDPHHFEAACNMGNAYLELNKINDALESYDLAIKINSRYAQAYSNRANAMRKLDRLEDALLSLDSAIEIDPHFSQAYLNRGVTMQALNRYEDAIECYDKAILIRHDYAEALTNRGTAQMALNRVQESIASYDQAIQRQADYVDAYWNKSLALLILGNFDEGWKLYESRWGDKSSDPQQRHFSQPLWLGEESLIGKTILLHAEQGLGDTLQFCRYTKLFKGLACTVILEVQPPLVALLESFDGVDEVIERGKPLPIFDYHCPLLSLPYAFKTQLNNILNQNSPYIHAKHGMREQWEKKLGEKKLPRVGIVWRGNIDHKNDKNRSMDLSQLLQFLPENIEYISLQKEINHFERHALQDRSVKDLGDSLLDFNDTAAICDLLDLIISVDTSVVHLAAAMGKKTWLLLPFAPDWRWMLHRSDSPWYQSMTIYRQDVSRNYQTVLECIKKDLTDQFGGKTK